MKKNNYMGLQEYPRIRQLGQRSKQVPVGQTCRANLGYLSQIAEIWREMSRFVFTLLVSKKKKANLSVAYSRGLQGPGLGGCGSGRLSSPRLGWRRQRLGRQGLITPATRAFKFKSLVTA
jgi:hypothetical protein